MQYPRKTRFVAILLTSLFVVFWFQAAGAQVRTMRIEGGEVFMLKELGAIISEGDNGLTVLMVLPPEQRAKAYRDIDLQEGDVIMMFNGKKMKTAAQMDEIYEGMKVGDEIKLGIKRGKDMMIAALAKANEDDLPGQMKMVKREGCPASGNITMTGVGLLLKTDNGKPVIDDVIEELTGDFSGPKPEQGDVLLKIQGTAIDKPEQVDEVLAKIKTGEKVDLVLKRGDEEIVTGFVKPECSQDKPLIIKKQG